MADIETEQQTASPTKILIVANRSMKGEALASAVRDRVEAGPCVFHVVVPVGSPVSSAIAVGSAAADMTPTACFDFQSERQAAEERLEAALAWCDVHEITATGALSTDADVVTTVGNLVETESFDEVIVSTLHTTVSRWLRQDLPHRIERKVDVPVAVVTPR